MFSELSESMKTKIHIMVFFIILLLIIIFYLIKKYLYAKKYEPVLVYQKTPFSDKKKLNMKKVEKSLEGIQVTYSTWLYINNAPENAAWNKSFKAPKVIISQDYSPAIAIIPFSNKLIFGVTSSCQYYTYEILEIPSQKWTHVVMVFNNRNVDFFINSKLYKSIFLPYVPDLSTSPVQFFPENDILFGNIASTRYFNRALNKNEVITLYDENKSNNPPTTSTFWWIPLQLKYPYLFFNILNFILFSPNNLRKILF